MSQHEPTNETDQATIDRIKKQIMALPDFVNTTDENIYIRVYALLELAVDVSPPDSSFIVEAMAEVETFYIEEKAKNQGWKSDGK